MNATGTSSAGVVDQKVESAAEEVVEVLAGLSPQKRIAIDALVVGHTTAKAAELAGRHRGTVSRWISEDAEFNAALNLLEREAIRLGNVRLMSLIPTALMVIEHAIDKGDVRAAVQLLKLTLMSRRTSGPTSAKMVEREMKVAELQQQATLQQQQADYQEVHEAAIERSKNAAYKTERRIDCEERERKEAAERAELRKQKADAAQAAAKAKQSQQSAVQKLENPKQNPTEVAKPTSAAPTASVSKHPGQSADREEDKRIAAAARSAAGSLSILKGPVSASPACPDAAPAQNPGNRNQS